MTLDEFFSGTEKSRRIFDTLCAAIEALGPAEVRVTKSQVAFRRSKAFAWAWIPNRYLHGRHAPLVLTLSLAQRNESPRWKEIVEPSRGRFSQDGKELWSPNWAANNSLSLLLHSIPPCYHFRMYFES
jgi:Domain of unknown function (DUF5655)